MCFSINASDYIRVKKKKKRKKKRLWVYCYYCGPKTVTSIIL